MKDSLIKVVYVSRNTIPGGDEALSREISRILDTARSLNQQTGITGALLFNRGLFAQVLEGPMASVEDTFERIQCDQRHADIAMLACEPISERSFDKWSMAYVGKPRYVPPILLELAAGTGFDPDLIDGDAVHESLRRMLMAEEDWQQSA